MRWIVALILMVAVVAASPGQAAAVDAAQAEQAAQAWLQRSAAFQNAATRQSPGCTFTVSTVTLLCPDSADDGYVFHAALQPRGFLLLNGDDRLPVVLGFSTAGNLDFRDRPENGCRALVRGAVAAGQARLRAVDAVAASAVAAVPARGATATSAQVDEAVANQLAWQALGRAASDSAGRDASVQNAAAREVASRGLDAYEASAPVIVVAPLLTTLWDQSRHFNFLCPADPDGTAAYDHKASTGCSAVAAGQILKYYSWPPYGNGSRSYADPGLIAGIRSADFAAAVYDWGNMKDEYDVWNAEPADQELAVATLLYHLGVAVETDYESGGSEASAALVASALARYFYYEPVALTSRAGDATAFANSLRAEILARRPAYVTIPGHAVVADGLETDSGADYYHINYGWGGTNDGWYLLGSIAGDPTDSGIFGIQPRLMPLFTPPTLPASATGSYTVAWSFPARRLPQVGRFRLYDGTLLADGFSDSCDSLAASLTWSNSGWTTSAQGYSGGCFRKTPVLGSSQTVAFRVPVMPTAASTLTFKYKAQLYHDRFSVDLSTDAGQTWATAQSVTGVYQNAWSDGNISLAGYAGQRLLLRFRYDFASGSYYGGGGVWLDSIAVNQCFAPDWQLLSDTLDAGTTSYGITGAAGGDHYYLVAAYNGLAAAWGDPSPALAVTVVGQPAAQRITFSALPDRTLGDAPFVLAATASSGLPVGFSVVSGPATVTGATLTMTGSGLVTVRASQAGNPGYQAAPPVEQSFTVGRATAGVTLGNLATVYDGTPKTATVTTVPAGRPVTVTYNGGATVPVNAGSYAVVATVNDPDYQGTASGTLTIARRSLTVAATDQARSYGDPNPAWTLTCVGFAAGENESVLDTRPTATCAATLTSPVGNYPIIPAGGSDGNYSFVYVNGTLAVSRASLTCRADAKTRAYGSGNPLLTLSYTGLRNGAAAPATPPTMACAATATSAPGEYPITLSGGSDPNYSLTLVPGTLTVTRKTLTATAVDQARAYGAANPPFTVAYTGFAPGDGPAVLDQLPTVACVASPESAVGTYAITLTGGADDHYAFALVAGTLTIGQATPTITWAAPAAVASGTALGPAQLSATADVAGTFTYAPAAGTILMAGTGQALRADFAPTDATNYRSVSKTVLIDVRKGSQTITWASCPLPRAAVGQAPFALQATATSGLPLRFTSGNPSVVGVSGNVATPRGAGVTTILASQAGDANWEPASDASCELIVLPATADFALTSIALEPPVPTLGGTFVAVVTVRNQGTKAASGGYLYAWLDRPAVAPLAVTGDKSISVGTLKPGATKVLRLTGLKAGTTEGPRTFRAFVNARNTTAEMDDTNNQAVLVWHAGRADFVVTRMEFVPAQPVCGKTFAATVIVRNAGESAGDGGYLDVWVNQPGVPVPGLKLRGDKAATVGVLQPGQEKTLRLTSLKSGAGEDRVFRAVVDSRTKTIESDESNNQAVLGYHCQPPGK